MVLDRDSEIFTTIGNTNMPKEIKIIVPSEPQFLKIVRLGVGHICEIAGFSTEDCNNITLAVDEACTNIIKYAYDGQTTKPIQITCNLFEDRVEFLLRDFGKKANLKEIKSRQLDDVRPGGLGVHLIKSVMDKVIYDNSFEIGNQLQLVKFYQK